jgi:opacity protein-like surface antigen
MKNTVVYLFFILFLMTGIAFSQIYFKAGGGYNLNFNSMEFGESSTSGVTGTTSYEAVYGSLGKGVNFAGAFGYNLTSNLGLELGITYKLSTDFETRNQSGTSVSTETISGSFFAFAPTIVVNAPTRNLKPFVKFGLLVAIPSADLEDVSSTGIQSKATLKDGIDFGLTGGAGVQIPIEGRIYFIAEVDFVSLTWKPSEIEVSSGTQTYTVKLKDDYNSSDPYTSGPIFVPFSNVGLNVGVLIGI